MGLCTQIHNIKCTIKNDTVLFEDDTFTYSYSKYLTNAQNEVTASCNETTYTKSVSNPTESKTYEVPYTAYNGVAYFREIESIKDHTTTNTSAAVSGGVGARTIDNPEAALTITKPGIYTITFVGYCRNSSDTYNLNIYKNSIDESTLLGQGEVTGSQNYPVTKSIENVTLAVGDELFMTGTTGQTYGDYIYVEKTGDLAPEQAVVTTAPWQEFVAPTGQASGKTFTELTEGANLTTKTLSVKVYGDTKPTLSVNGGEYADPGWTAYNDTTNGCKIYYVQFMAASDAFDGFGDVKAKVGTTVLDLILVEEPTP